MKNMYIFLDTKSIRSALNGEVEDIKNIDRMKECARLAKNSLYMTPYEKSQFNILNDSDLKLIDQNNKTFFRKSEIYHMDYVYTYIKDGKVFYTTIHDTIDFDDDEDNDDIDIRENTIVPINIKEEYEEVSDLDAYDVDSNDTAMNMLMKTMSNLNTDIEGMSMFIDISMMLPILKKALIGLVITVGCQFIKKLDEELSEYDDMDGYEYIHDMAKENDKEEIVKKIKEMFKKPIDKFVKFIKSKFNQFLKSESMGMSIPIIGTGTELNENSDDKILPIFVIDKNKKYNVSFEDNVEKATEPVVYHNYIGSPTDNIDRFIVNLLEEVKLDIDVKFENTKTTIIGIDRNIVIDKDMIDEFVVMTFTYFDKDVTIKYDKIFLEEVIRYGFSGITKSNLKKINKAIDPNIIQTMCIMKKTPSSLDKKFYVKFIKFCNMSNITKCIWDGHYIQNGTHFYIFHDNVNKYKMISGGDNDWFVDKIKN